MESILNRLINLMETTAPELWAIAMQQVQTMVASNAIWAGTLLVLLIACLAAFVDVSVASLAALIDVTAVFLTCFISASDVSLAAFVDGFYIMKTNNATGVETLSSNPNRLFNEMIAIQNPRMFRFGLRFQF